MDWEYHHHNNSARRVKVSRMMKGTLDLTGIDTNDFDLVEKAWNDWTRELHARGLRPSEQPLPESTESVWVYSLHPIGGLDEFNSRVELGIIVTHQSVLAPAADLVGGVA
jgi:hypothetical protein